MVPDSDQRILVEIHMKTPKDDEPFPLIGLVITRGMRVKQIEDMMLEAARRVVGRMIEKDMLSYQPFDEW